MSLIQALNWRYATKKMNGTAVPQEKVDSILEAARLAPTSSGLQPYKVIVITNPAVKESLLPHSFNQAQIVDCSHLLVFAAWDNYTEERINSVFERTIQERGLPTNAMDDYKNMLIGTYTPRTPEVNFQHAARQAYIGFGIAIAEAALQNVDATPMEGFVNDQYDEILDLKSQGLKSVCILPLGYRDEAGDWLVNMKKVRQSTAEFVTEFK